MENLVSSTIENIFIRHGQIFNFKQICNLESGSQGECGATGSPISCSPTAVKDTFLDMRVSLDDGYGDDDGVSQGCPEGSASTSLQCTGLGIQFCCCLVKVKSYLTGKEPRERLRELVLEEHVECGCQCDPQVNL